MSNTICSPVVLRQVLLFVLLVLLVGCGGGFSSNGPPETKQTPVQLNQFDAENLASWLTANPKGLITLMAGQSQEARGVRFTCPANGPNCRITVSQDGQNLIIISTGGVVAVEGGQSTVDITSIDVITIASFLAAYRDNFTVRAGYSQNVGGITFSCPSGGENCRITVSQDNQNNILITSIGGMAFAKPTGSTLLSTSNTRTQQPPIAPGPVGKPVAAHFRAIQGYLGFGPAFESERPAITDLDSATESTRSGFKVRSGDWRDSRGRDGTRTAQQAIDYLQSLQDLFSRNKRRLDPTATTGNELVTVDFGEQKTVRVYHTATAEDRRLLLTTLQEVNTALPYNQRLLLGEDTTSLVTTAASVPRNEILVYFTDGKANWPQGDYDDALGIGGTVTFDPQDNKKFVVFGGYVFIDNQNRVTSNLVHQKVIAHEIVHAFGMGTHADPTQFPLSLMVPTTLNFRRVPLFYLNDDGDGVLAASTIGGGRTVADLNVADHLDSWTSSAFHLLGYKNLNSANQQIEFGAGFRNGLSKPWIYGIEPTAPLQNNQAFQGVDSATWNGSLMGFSASGETVAGDAKVEIVFSSSNGTVDFDNLEQWGVKSHPGTAGSGDMWGDGDLDYSVRLSNEGNINRFESTFADDDDPGVVSGTFVGSQHEGAAGIVEHPDLSAAFGATR